MNSPNATKRVRSLRYASATDKLAFDRTLYLQLRAFVKGGISNSPVIGDLIIGKERAEQYLREHENEFKKRVAGFSRGVHKHSGIVDVAHA